MAFKHSYTFVLGAGASVPYGFPTGKSLAKKIANEYPALVEEVQSNAWWDVYSMEHELMNWSASINRLVERFGKTTGTSIDRFLNLNKDFKDEGIRGIAALLIQAEQNSILPSISNKEISGDWYTYFFERFVRPIATHDNLAVLKEQRVSFISFNYDRSFKHFLFQSLHNLLAGAGVSERQIAEALSHIEFVNVYGSLGQLPWDRYNPENISPESSLEYGSTRYRAILKAVEVARAGNISVMYEDRIQAGIKTKIEKIFSMADRIMFLGFGFDEDNLRILGIPNSIAGKDVFATCHDLVENEIEHIRNLLGMSERSSPIKKNRVRNCDCLMLLREYLV